MNKQKAEDMQNEFMFYELDGLYRIVASFDTKKEDADAFVHKLQGIGCR
jgi:hypothetical protein